MTVVLADSGSFRDPNGQIFQKGGEIYRTVARGAAADYEFVRDSGLIRRLAARGLVLEASEVERARLGPAAAAASYLLAHPLIRFVSYPYEWPFAALRAAALLHLDVQLEALEADVSLSDATAYNVQFIGPKPVFIDHLSFRRYRDGEIWAGHRQFCEQFLNPLLLRALLGVPHNAWFRGAQEGIPTAEISRLIPLRRKLSWNVLSNVVLPAALEKSSRQTDSAIDNEAIRRAVLPRASYRAMLIRLRRWIEGLKPADTCKTVWGDYARSHSYSSAEVDEKKAFIGRMACNVKPALLWDFGCNTGDYSKVALESGATYAIGFDFDHGALDLAFERANVEGLAFLPLLMDAANPSPDQGWSEAERKGLSARASADALLALAFVHHLAIGRNVPLGRVIDWLIGMAPVGVVEFVPKSDPMIQRMLRLRDDIFDDYTEEHFLAAIGRRACVVESATVSASGRQLVWYDRSDGR